MLIIKYRGKVIDIISVLKILFWMTTSFISGEKTSQSHKF